MGKRLVILPPEVAEVDGGEVHSGARVHDDGRARGGAPPERRRGHTVRVSFLVAGFAHNRGHDDREVAHDQRERILCVGGLVSRVKFRIVDQRMYLDESGDDNFGAPIAQD